VLAAAARLLPEALTKCQQAIALLRHLQLILLRLMRSSKAPCCSEMLKQALLLVMPRSVRGYRFVATLKQSLSICSLPNVQLSAFEVERACHN
jgi:hypothetical protein